MQIYTMYLVLWAFRLHLCFYRAIITYMYPSHRYTTLQMMHDSTVFAFLCETKKPDFAWKSGFYRILLFFTVVPPGIVINTQAALYLHFKESQNPQSPPIAPPQNCAVRQRLAESSSYFDAKVMKIFETEMTTLKFCSTSVRNP